MKFKAEAQRGIPELFRLSGYVSVSRDSRLSSAHLKRHFGEYPTWLPSFLRRRHDLLIKIFRIASLREALLTSCKSLGIALKISQVSRSLRANTCNHSFFTTIISTLSWTLPSSLSSIPIPPDMAREMSYLSALDIEMSVSKPLEGDCAVWSELIVVTIWNRQETVNIDHLPITLVALRFYSPVWAFFCVTTTGKCCLYSMLVFQVCSSAFPYPCSCPSWDRDNRKAFRIVLCFSRASPKEDIQ